ncbi:MAG: FHA domain-containing protein [Clostridiales bacterium]|nr:FHA domain-containing protein [Clostridiales bacterium]
MPVSYSTTGKITGIKGMYAGYEFPLRSGETLFISKNPQECQIVIDQSVGSYVSRKHCSISYNNQRGNYTVIDYSTNGVFLEPGTEYKTIRPLCLTARRIYISAI